VARLGWHGTVWLCCHAFKCDFQHLLDGLFSQAPLSMGSSPHATWKQVRWELCAAQMAQDLLEKHRNLGHKDDFSPALNADSNLRLCTSATSIDPQTSASRFTLGGYLETNASSPSGRLKGGARLQPHPYRASVGNTAQTSLAPD